MSNMKTEAEQDAASPIEPVVMCKCPSGLPTKKMYKETQFSTVKKRTGKESVPFLGLASGTHKVKFYTETKSIIRNVKTWLSPYGYAWIIMSDT